MRDRFSCPTPRLVAYRRRGLAAGVLAALAVGGLGCAEEQDSRTAPTVGAPVRAPELARPQLAAWRSGHQIVRATADGRALRVLVGRSAGRGPPATLFEPAQWSPNGLRLAFTARPGGPFGSRTDIYMMRADGSGRHRITSDGRSSYPLWAPDGQRIYLVREGPPAPVGDEGRTATPGAIWSMRPDGSDLQQLTSLETGRYDIPGSFTPDGRTLAFTRAAPSELEAGGPEINTRQVWLLNLERLEARKLIDRGQDPAFSPDGRRIAFVSDRDKNGELTYGDRGFFANELYVVQADGSRPNRLTRTRAHNERHPSWLPSGKRLAYQLGRSYQNAEATVVIQANADGSCPQPVFANPGRDRWPWYAAPTWRPGDAQSGDGPLAC
jgi:Tol biopolymer transport system component